MKTRSLLRLEDKLAGHDAHLRALGRGEQRLRLTAALVAALAAHAALALVPTPRVGGRVAAPPGRAEYPVVVRWVPRVPEPAREPASAGVARPVSGGAAPQPANPAVAPPPEGLETLDALIDSEPVVEPPPQVRASLPRDAETLIGTPVPPPLPEGFGPEADAPATRPMVARDGRVEPDYPPAARLMRLAGNVMLEVSVSADGTVGAITVVGTSRPGLGFEEAAVAAVKRWRFVPATRAGRPIAATTSVEIDFR